MSMIDAERYDELFTTMDSKEFLLNIKAKLTFNGAERVLDVGCGPGKVTAKLLPLILPKNSIIVGSDISANMIEYANEKYAEDNISFRVLDIGATLMAPWDTEIYSKIFSFKCFQRIENIRKAFENIYKLLRPGGEFIAQSISDCYWYHAHKYLSSIPKYKIYEKELLSIIPSKDFTIEFIELLKDVGFEIIYSEVKKYGCDFQTRDNLYELIESISWMPYLFPKKVKEEMMSVLKMVESEKLLLNAGRENSYPYELISFVAIKPKQ